MALDPLPSVRHADEGMESALFAFSLIILTTTTAVWLNAHRARLDRHHRGRPSSSECSATVAAMLMLERGGCHCVDIIAASMANHPRVRARGLAVILPSCDLDDMSVAAMADAAAAVGTYLHRASRGWPARLEVFARAAGGVALVAMIPAVALSWLPGSGALWVVAACAAVLAMNEGVFAWRRHDDHVVGAAQLELARVVRRGAELASIANLLRWRLAPSCAAAAVFAVIATLAAIFAVR